MSVSLYIYGHGGLNRTRQVEGRTGAACTEEFEARSACRDPLAGRVTGEPHAGRSGARAGDPKPQPSSPPIRGRPSVRLGGAVDAEPGSPGPRLSSIRRRSPSIIAANPNPGPPVSGNPGLRHDG